MKNLIGSIQLFNLNNINIELVFKVAPTVTLIDSETYFKNSVYLLSEHY